MKTTNSRINQAQTKGYFGMVQATSGSKGLFSTPVVQQKKQPNNENLSQNQENSKLDIQERSQDQDIFESDLENFLISKSKNVSKDRSISLHYTNSNSSFKIENEHSKSSKNVSETSAMNFYDMLKSQYERKEEMTQGTKQGYGEENQMNYSVNYNKTLSQMQTNQQSQRTSSQKASMMRMYEEGQRRNLRLKEKQEEKLTLENKNIRQSMIFQHQGSKNQVSSFINRMENDLQSRKIKSQSRKKEKEQSEIDYINSFMKCGKNQTKSARASPQRILSYVETLLQNSQLKKQQKENQKKLKEMQDYLQRIKLANSKKSNKVSDLMTKNRENVFKRLANEADKRRIKQTLLIHDNQEKLKFNNRQYLKITERVASNRQNKYGQRIGNKKISQSEKPSLNNTPMISRNGSKEFQTQDLKQKSSLSITPIVSRNTTPEKQKQQQKISTNLKNKKTDSQKCGNQAISKKIKKNFSDKMIKIKSNLNKLYFGYAQRFYHNSKDQFTHSKQSHRNYAINSAPSSPNLKSTSTNKQNMPGFKKKNQAQLQKQKLQQFYNVRSQLIRKDELEDKQRQQRSTQSLEQLQDIISKEKQRINNSINLVNSMFESQNESLSVNRKSNEAPSTIDQLQFMQNNQFPFQSSVLFNQQELTEFSDVYITQQMLTPNHNINSILESQNLIQNQNYLNVSEIQEQNQLKVTQNISENLVKLNSSFEVDEKQGNQKIDIQIHKSNHNLIQYRQNKQLQQGQVQNLVHKSQEFTKGNLKPTQEEIKQEIKAQNKLKTKAKQQKQTLPNEDEKDELSKFREKRLELNKRIKEFYKYKPNEKNALNQQHYFVFSLPYNL